MESGPTAGKEMRGGAWEKMQNAIAKECLNRLAAL